MKIMGWNLNGRDLVDNILDFNTRINRSYDQMKESARFILFLTGLIVCFGFLPLYVGWPIVLVIAFGRALGLKLISF